MPAFAAWLNVTAERGGADVDRCQACRCAMRATPRAAHEKPGRSSGRRPLLPALAGDETQAQAGIRSGTPGKTT